MLSCLVQNLPILIGRCYPKWRKRASFVLYSTIIKRLSGANYLNL